MPTITYPDYLRSVMKHQSDFLTDIEKTFIDLVRKAEDVGFVVFLAVESKRGSLEHGSRCDSSFSTDAHRGEKGDSRVCRVFWDL